MTNKTPKKMVAICMGQSNAANHGDVRLTAPQSVTVLGGMELIPASDPLPGASGEGGSVWTRLGTSLVASSVFEEVVFIPIAVDGSAVAEWSPKGKCYPKFADACDRARQAGQEVTHVFWHQGERDTALKSGYDHYLGHLAEIVSAIRTTLPLAKIIICTASYRFGETNKQVRTAQSAICERNDIVQGPDTDKIGEQWRHDNLHFNADGQQKFSDLLIGCII